MLTLQHWYEHDYNRSLGHEQRFLPLAIQIIFLNHLFTPYAEINGPDDVQLSYLPPHESHFFNTLKISLTFFHQDELIRWSRSPWLQKIYMIGRGVQFQIILQYSQHWYSVKCTSEMKCFQNKRKRRRSHKITFCETFAFTINLLYSANPCNE